MVQLKNFKKFTEKSRHSLSGFLFPVFASLLFHLTLLPSQLTILM